MFTFYITLALLLLLALGGGVARVLRGPTAPDRMLAAQLFGSAGVALPRVGASGVSEGLARIGVSHAESIPVVRRAAERWAGDG